MDRKLIHIQPSSPDQAHPQAALSPVHPSPPNTRASRRRRVRQACYACRKYKTRCTGAPCKRCQSHGLICEDNAKKTRQSVPERYIETLEESQSALCAAVRKLYAMVRNRDEWTAAEPELEDGEPVILDIVSKLGRMRSGERTASPSDRFLLKEQVHQPAQGVGMETESMSWVVPDTLETQPASYFEDSVDPFSWYGQVDTDIINDSEYGVLEPRPSQYPFYYYNPTTTSCNQSTAEYFSQSFLTLSICTPE